jgi:hypothetical protein
LKRGKKCAQNFFRIKSNLLGYVSNEMHENGIDGQFDHLHLVALLCSLLIDRGLRRKKPSNVIPKNISNVYFNLNLRGLLRGYLFAKNKDSPAISKS